jgi:hypothetical protein
MQATWVHSFGLAYSDLERREEEFRVTTFERRELRCVVLEIGQHAPLTWRESAKISKLLLADLCCNTLKQRLRKFLSFNKNSHKQNQKIKLIIDLSKQVSH